MIRGRLAVSLLAVAFVFVPSAAAGPGKVETASKGNVTATFSYTKTGDFNYSGVHLKIVRAGQTVLDAGLPKSDCGYCDAQPFSVVEGSGKSVRLVDLDGSGEPEVIVDLYSGGAHCCVYSYIYRYTGSSYARAKHLWGNPSYSLKDLDGDGKPEVLTNDDRFAYTFTAYAFSVDAIQVLQYRNGHFVDVTRKFPSLPRNEGNQLWKSYLKDRNTKDFDPRGVLAAYVADEYQIGQGAKAWQDLVQAYHEGRVNNIFGLGTTGRRYLDQVRKTLKAWGYIRGALPPLPAA